MLSQRALFRLPPAFAMIVPIAMARAEVSVGSAAPDFTATDSKGGKHDLSQLEGRTVVLVPPIRSPCTICGNRFQGLLIDKRY